MKITPNKVAEYAKRRIARARDNTIALHHLLKMSRRKINKDRIRVAFLVQYVPSWNKVELIYNEMLAHPQFEVELVCVPLGIHDNKVDNPDDMRNDTYEYFIEHGYDAINARVGRDEWLDLEKRQYDYIFYMRPYDNYMPLPYVSSQVCRYSRICLVLYAMILTTAIPGEIINRQFMQHVSYFFAETTYSRDYNISQFRMSHLLGIRKTFYYGVPAIDELMAARDKQEYQWDRLGTGLRVMWTPRWTMDEHMGESTFFKYKDALLDYAQRNEHVKFLFRPHPLAFDNFIKTGLMTASEVEAYKQRIESIGNVRLDREKEYSATMWKSDALISDISGIIPEYFATGKPLIYCPCGLQLTPYMKRIEEGCYVVHNEEELFEVLDNLAEGRDELKEARAQICSELFGDIGKTAQHIVEELSR